MTWDPTELPLLTIRCLDGVSHNTTITLDDRTLYDVTRLELTIDAFDANLATATITTAVRLDAEIAATVTTQPESRTRAALPDRA